MIPAELLCGMFVIFGVVALVFCFVQWVKNSVFGMKSNTHEYDLTPMNHISKVKDIL